MKKTVLLSLLLLILLLLAGCEDESIAIIGGADGPTKIVVDKQNDKAEKISEGEIPTDKPVENLPSESVEYIGEERAKEIALDRAQLKETDVKYIKTELDFDDGVWKYEIEFKKDKTEYEADVDAISGEILSWDVDFND